VIMKMVEEIAKIFFLLAHVDVVSLYFENPLGEIPP
jgi:hypothetical protein